MAAYDQQLVWQQGSAQTTLPDATQAASSVPRRVKDYLSYTLCHAAAAGAPKGKLRLFISTAPVAAGALVEPADWVPLDQLEFNIDGTVALPVAQQVVLNAVGWTMATWTPAGGSGQLRSTFDGVRRGQ